MIKIEIKSVFGKVLFEYAKEDNSFRETILQALLSGADLSGANLRHANLSGADLNGADLRHADLSGADLNGADLNGANLSGADLRHADLSGADLNGADLNGADLRHADLSGADLSGADLRHADLSGADLGDANLRHADLSDAKNFFSTIDYLQKTFKATDKGLIVYKTFGGMYSPNKNWKIEPGAIIEEAANPTLTQQCGCGINVAPLDWVKKNYKGDIWECLIEWPWLVGVVVPYNTDGKIRASRVRLIKNIERG